MAGIGFTLKRLFKKDTFIDRTKAYIYSGIVAAGPWIASVVTVNVMLWVSKKMLVSPSDRYLFMGTIVYSFIFSQILTAPGHFITTRYISDKLFSKEYVFIKPCFIGISKITFFAALFISLAFYYSKPLPLYYKFMAASLFIIISLIWVITVFLSAVKDYSIISKAFIGGGLISVCLSILLNYFPISFPLHLSASTMLLSYLIGMTVTYIIVFYSFLDSFYFGNKKNYDFIKYLNKTPSLFFVGLFYTLGLWVDNILMWYSEHGAIIYGTYRYAPLYDHAVFLAFLTIIPTMILFMVYLETEFYEVYKKYYSLVSIKGNYDDIVMAKNKMVELLYRHIVYVLENQTLITFTLIVLSGAIFSYLGYAILLRDIFRICALGTLSNAIMLVVLLVLLYFEARIQAVAVSIIFFASNLLFNLYFIPLGVAFYGVGYFLAALLSLVVSLVLLRVYLKNIIYLTFSKQPAFSVEDKGIFVSIAKRLNRNTEE
ncbi:MAG: hypothetical protein COA82_04410 [Alkaliphilus sp.]|nr:exopolysaccharide Pel transporter PelG [bacterium AH-315-L21]PHS35490.1 MAG: hypothetical protein COA82_04410 [Alkaliphilus sp.]